MFCPREVTTTTTRILRRHVGQFWYLPAAGEAAAAAAAGNKICRKETLGTLLARFGNYVVLQGHVAFPLAGDFFRACFPAESFQAES